ncbi:nicotinate phosphoribosyltransferase [Halorubrum vacuolatum]|uniref:Nicotinate phosphoribosyltransferase n=1 Tax=Halorubrum vacuolatum TaxID=63740 RepID=A0A238VTX5_HALVU|nr:nicotinate phosphoribosyltransferase [Halorubrum vacuolatum]SNR37604.1 nicotinate phosphoribosyltransferase [Halorubrum vacuolatum]
MTDFDIVGPEAIREGRATDAYFERTETTLREAGRNPRVVAEVTADQFPDGEFELFAGLKDAVALLEGRPVDVDALPEGRLFDGGPVMRIEGEYRSFARFETSLLGFLSHASGIATAALDCRVVAPDATVFSFGARHVHPAMAATVERSALLAGFDGFSHVAAGDLLGREAAGTMPHALVLCFGPGEQEAAWVAFDEAVDDDVPRIALCDTYTDERDETLRAVAALGDRLDGVRIDTTGSRRGDFRHIVREVRWELAAAGRPELPIYVSGGLGPDDLRELRDVVEGFGVGGYVSNADPVDFSLDLVAVDGTPGAKRGKLSGVKEAYRTADGAHAVRPSADPAPDDAEPLLTPVLRDGSLVDGADDLFALESGIERARSDASLVGYGEA